MTGNTNVGGIVGENRADGIVLTCYNKGTIVGTNEVGGICGMNRGILQNCENEGKINDEDLKTTLDLNGIDIGTLNLTQNVVTRNDAAALPEDRPARWQAAPTKVKSAMHISATMSAV